MYMYRCAEGVALLSFDRANWMSIDAQASGTSLWTIRPRASYWPTRNTRPRLLRSLKDLVRSRMSACGRPGYIGRWCGEIRIVSRPGQSRGHDILRVEPSSNRHIPRPWHPYDPVPAPATDLGVTLAPTALPASVIPPDLVVVSPALSSSMCSEPGLRGQYWSWVRMSKP